jgi:hypothetical protein
VKELGKSDKDTLAWLSAQRWLLLFNGADNVQLDLHQHFPQAHWGNIIITTQNPELCIHTSQSNFHVTGLSSNEAKSLVA